MRTIFISPKAEEILRKRGIVLDAAAPATRPTAGETKLVTARELLETFLRVRGLVHVDAQSEANALALLNGANQEFWG